MHLVTALGPKEKIGEHIDEYGRHVFAVGTWTNPFIHIEELGIEIKNRKIPQVLSKKITQSSLSALEGASKDERGGVTLKDGKKISLRHEYLEELREVLNMGAAIWGN